MALVAAVVATVITRTTPAARARSSTAGRSSRKRSSSRWACVSMSSVMSVPGRRRERRCQLLQRLQMGLLQGQELPYQVARLGFEQVEPSALQVGDGFPLLLHELRPAGVQGDEV